MSITQHIPTQSTKPEVKLTPDADGKWVVSDPNLLFDAEFERAGHDLLLVNEGSPDVRIPDYFATETPADIFSHNGSVLRGDTVETLAGPLAPGQYAQAGSVANSVGPIGQVETVDGAASVQRSDGTVEDLNVGMKVFENDVVQTGEGGSLSVTFVDGTIFTLSASSRMVIDELIYDPDGSDNSGTFNLIQGGFVFIAGQVAKTGGMEVSTPSATMGIRGTTVLVSVEMVGGEIISEVSLTRDPDGDVGEIELRNINGEVVANVTDIDSIWVLTTQNGDVRQEPRTLSDDAEDNLLIAEVINAYRTAFGRVEAGDTFVSLDSASSGSTTGMTSETPSDSLELDAIDEPLGIESAPSETQDTGDSDGSFDEGNLIQPAFDAPVVTVAGLEDSDATAPITGEVGIVPDVGQTLVYSLEGQATNGTALINADGSFTFVPNPDFNGDDTFSYRVTDNDTLDEVGIVTVRVLPVNDAPEIEDARATTPEDGSLAGSLRATDIDGDVLTFSLASGPANGTATVRPDGTYTYTPSADFNGIDSFTVVVSDAEDVTATARITVSVTSGNDAPIPTTRPEDARGEVIEDATSIVARGSLSFTDIDSGDTAIWSGGGVGAYGRFAISPLGDWTFTVDTASVQFLGEGERTTDSFDFTVTDAGGLSATETVTVTITGTNDAPVIATPSGDESGTVVEGDETTTTSGRLIATDPDLGASLTWSGDALGAYGRFEIDTDGNWVYRIDNVKAEPLSAGSFATETFVATVTDPSGATASQMVTLTIVGTNDAPTVARSTVIEVTEETTFSGTLVASDIDSSGALVFSLGGTAPAHGVVTVDADGGFEYTPDAGYVGLDSFEFTVTDSDGASTTGLVTVEVESPGLSSDPAAIVGISTTASATAPAGTVFFESFPSTAPQFNLAIALDRSGSIGTRGWNEQVTAVADALEDLADLYRDAISTFDVQIITFATDALTFGPFDLLDPSLPDTVRALEYTSGVTDWGGALNAAEDFYDAQSSAASNVLLFITDGAPTGGDWVGAYDSLTDSEANGYSVTVEAYGIGAGVDLSTLTRLDASPTLLSSPADLVAGLGGSSVFNPELVDFQLTLTADGIDKGIIADETHPSLVRDDLRYDLPLAEIDGIETLLGDVNRFSATVRYDLDGDLDTAELVLFTTELFAPSDAAEVLVGLEGSDLLLGGTEGDMITGAGGTDVLLGLEGDDTIDGGAEADVVVGGGGDDTIIIADRAGLAGEKIDGGVGTDTVAIDLVGDLTVDVLPVLDLSSIEAIDMSNGLSNDLELRYSDIADLSSEEHQELEALIGSALDNSAVILGDTSDTLTLSNTGTGSFRASDIGLVVDSDGNSLEVYEYVQDGIVLATLGVDDDVVVDIPVA